jgi:hypothetical protein
MPSTANQYGLRSKRVAKSPLINHFTLTHTAEGKNESKEYTIYKQALQAIKSKSRRKVSPIVCTTPPVPRVADFPRSPSRPPLQDFTHIVFPLCDIRSELPERENHLYWDTLNIPAFNQNRGAKDSEDKISPTTHSTRRPKLIDTLAVTLVHPSRPRPRRRILTAAVTLPYTPPSPSGSELSSIDEAVLAQTPEAFKDGVSIAIMSSLSLVLEARCLRRRRSTGPRLGIFIEPIDATPPLFDYSAAAYRLRDHNTRKEQHDAEISRRFNANPLTVYTSAFETLGDNPRPREVVADQTFAHEEEGASCTHHRAIVLTIEHGNEDGHPPRPTSAEHRHEDDAQPVDQDIALVFGEAIAQVLDDEGEDQEESDGDPMDVDEPETAAATTPILHMPSPVHPPHPANQPTWLHVRPSPPREHISKRKCSADGKDDVSIEDVLHKQAKKARKERTQTPTAAPPAFGTIGSRKDSGWRQGLMDSVVAADAWKKGK